MKPDDETIKTMSEAERAAIFIAGDDWRWLKGLLVTKMIDVQSVANVDVSNPENLAIDIKARRAVVEILKEVIEEIEGKAAQTANAKDMSPAQKDDTIEYYP